ncbi:hypothetical protein T492DRAFT_1038026 [Pavlovales sp. CCMP2436]|nr:hypothetical protein T492DRAFT_1038026 [Pavlovales sp. CCMP2436]
MKMATLCVCSTGSLMLLILLHHRYRLKRPGRDAARVPGSHFLRQLLTAEKIDRSQLLSLFCRSQRMSTVGSWSARQSIVVDCRVPDQTWR